MIVLALETCFDACSAAVFDDAADRLVARFEPMATGQAERLVPMISEVMDEAGTRFDELDAIAVTFGPGTFTGMRIGVAAARSLALATGRPLLTTTSLAVIAQEARTLAPASLCGADILVAMDARRDEVYVQSFRNGEPLAAPVVEPPLAALRNWVGTRPPDRPEALIVAGTASDAIAEEAKKLGIGNLSISPVRLPSAACLARLAPQLSSEGHNVSPLYLRPADAKPQIGKSIARVTP